jgi:hypothetical protein
MDDPEPNAPTGRALLLGLVLIAFGLAMVVLTFLTLIGPILGLILIAFGIFTIWKSARGEPPQSL